METATQRDYLKSNADNIWFVLGAYFFAFFPWAILNNIDFISEKWRTCRRTRNLARIQLVSYILPVIYVAVYAEAQRRKEDNKEFAAALTALMFNIYQMMRTIMGWVQLNAFVAWCKHAAECIRALEGDDHETSSSSSNSAEGRSKDDRRRMMEIVVHWQKVFVSWCGRMTRQIRALLRRDGENGVQRRNEDEKNREASVNVNGDGDGNDVNGAEGASPGINRENGKAVADADSNGDEGSQSVEGSVESRDSEHEVEDKVMVNNMVVDNELGGTEVTVLPSWKKIWSGVKKGSFTPSKWLKTDRVILNTVRWGGAYLCGMGKYWSAEPYSDVLRSECGEILESFFSRELENVRSMLQFVEWDMNMENDGHEFLSIHKLDDDDDDDDIVELTGEMSTAYGHSSTKYDVEDTYAVDAYSFEFASLVGSYPSGGEMYSTANRERINVGLVHSVLLAKHLGVEKLQAIRQYYNRYCVPEGAFLRNAFKYLVEQIGTRIPDDAKIWKIFGSNDYEIPIFPYRMQMVALWEEATNWRVSQGSAHYDSSISLTLLEVQNEEEKRALHNARHPVNIFDYCAKWTIKQLGRCNDEWNVSLGVVMETVRTFLAEWVAASTREANWEPEIPMVCVEFNTGKIRQDENYSWICQRELQRKIAKMSREEENFPGNAALIMFFILGLPLLKVDQQEAEVDAHDDQGEVQEVSMTSTSNKHCSVTMSVRSWRFWTVLSPQDISLIVRVDETKGTWSLRLQNDSGDSRFIWQNWVDAAMGCMKGFEEGGNGKWGYGRKIMRANLRRPMVEMCPLRIDGDGIEKTVSRTSTARMWMGWPAFDVRICKFEVEQWLDACDVNIRGDKIADREVERVESVIKAVISECS